MEASMSALVYMISVSESPESADAPAVEPAPPAAPVPAALPPPHAVRLITMPIASNVARIRFFMFYLPLRKIKVSILHKSHIILETSKIQVAENDVCFHPACPGNIAAVHDLTEL